MKRSLLVVASLAIVIALLAASFFFWKTKVGNIKTPFSSPSVLEESFSIPELLKSLQKEFSVSGDLITLHQNWFSSEKNRSIPLTGQMFTIKAAQTPTLEKFLVKSPTISTPYEINTEGLTLLKDKIVTFFSAREFKLNTENSEKNEEFLSSDETNAFEKGDVFCLSTIRTLDPVANFFCGRYDSEYEALRSQFIAVLNPTNDPEVFVEVSKVEGDYARGGVGGMGGGAEWYAVKEEGKWKVVAQSQMGIACSVVEKYNIPQNIYDECLPEQ